MRWLTCMLLLASPATLAQQTDRASPPASIEAPGEKLDAAPAPPAESPAEPTAPPDVPETPAAPADPWAAFGGSSTMASPTAEGKERMVIMPVVPDDEIDAAIAIEATARLAGAYAKNDRFDVRWGPAFYASVEGDAKDEFGSCAKARCVRDVAEATKARFVVYTRMFEGAQGAVIDLKVFSSRQGRPVMKTNAESPVKDARTLLPVIPQLVQGAIPAVEKPKPEGEEGEEGDKDEEEPTLFDNPIFVTGVATVFIGAFMVAGGTAHVLASERAVSTPGVHRFLKEDALNTWYWGLVAAGAGAAVIAAGTAGIGAGLVLETLE